MARVAVKLAYDGTRFSGSQVQPGVRTVHGELAGALRKLGLDDARLRWAGRTDAGVSAAGNVAVFDAPAADEKLLPSLTFAMEDAWAWAVAAVPDDFEPRHATSRVYRYFLRTDLDAAPLERALGTFLGTHDFTRFSRLEPGVNPVRTVLRVAARRRGPHVALDVEGESFLWNQVRRMVAAAERVAAGDASDEDVARGLRGDAVDLGCAAPEPLVLLDVQYAGVTFRSDARVRGRVFERLASRLAALRREEAVLSTLFDAGADGA